MRTECPVHMWVLFRLLTEAISVERVAIPAQRVVLIARLVLIRRKPDGWIPILCRACPCSSQKRSPNNTHTSDLLSHYLTAQQQHSSKVRMVVAALHPLPFCPPNFHGGWTIRMHRMIIAMSFSGRPRPGAGRAFIFGPVRPFAWPVRRHQTPRQEPLTHDSFRDRQEGVHVVFPGSSSVFLPHVVLCKFV